MDGNTEEGRSAPGASGGRAGESSLRSDCGYYQSPGGRDRVTERRARRAREGLRRAALQQPRHGRRAPGRECARVWKAGVRAARGVRAITSETTSPSAPASARGIYLMGMCSRQERIQKDIDVVIQKSRAEKDCLFADFRYSDSTFTFTYVGGPKSHVPSLRSLDFK
ncbi:hypothetical protein J1605_013620 [Eschrichtius robustus]|uniref:Protein mono-ADP-ribosyltransferase PARP8 n=1 Tax=Eschrichtius robustus TaxID=9764 RepID=A0AB34GH61_ESCRO|nr:hypothetical protein J1605_013620 [Eschrichtius robustus]